MKIAVTGAGGFIGRVLLRTAPSVYELKIHTGLDCPLPDELIQSVDNYVADIADREMTAELIRDTDMVIHLAGPPSVADSFREPVRYVEAHVAGTAQIVDQCLQQGVRRLIYLSSAEIYGRQQGNAVAENASPAPRSPYAAAKMGAEALVAAASRSGKLEAIILRPFSVYGPGIRRAGVLGAILSQVIQRRSEIELFDLRPVRDYVFVDDLTEAVWRACRMPASDGISVFNIASGIGVSVGDLAAKTLEVAGQSAEIIQTTAGDRPSAADIRFLVGDVSTTDRLLGWHARTSLSVGLSQSLEWFSHEFYRHEET